MSTKHRIDILLLVHAIVALVSGSLALVFPHAFEWFMLHHGEKFALRDNSNGDGKVEHVTIRLYGALIIAQSWITFSARRSVEAHFRRALVQAYCGCFLLTTLTLLRAQLTEGGHFNAFNYINILLFFSLTCSYGWFAFFERLAVFEGLGKVGV